MGRGRVKHLESDEESDEVIDLPPKRSRKEEKRSPKEVSNSGNEVSKPKAEEPKSTSSPPSGFSASSPPAGFSGVLPPAGFAASSSSTPSMVASAGASAAIPGMSASLPLTQQKWPPAVIVPTMDSAVGIPSARVDFSKPAKDAGVLSSTIDVPRKFVSVLMTEAHQQLFVEESGAKVEWKLPEAKAIVSGSAEQIKQAQRLFNRVNTHCIWGISAEKIRRLLKPRKVESVQCRLTPMGSLPGGRKTLNNTNRTMTVGKGPDNDIILPGSGIVSRLHCILEFDEERGAVYIHDCSTNGTYLNGTRLPAQQSGKVILSHGDEILLKEQTSIKEINEFGYILNLKEISVKAEMKLVAPSRLLAPDEAGIVMRDFRS